MNCSRRRARGRRGAIELFTAGVLNRFTNSCGELWRELFTRATFLIGRLIGQICNQGD
jgi:hypothetical protein